MSQTPYYITTAIAYTSGKPHIGNNYEIVLADAIARFKRKQGYDVFFQTGTDEHGQKIELKAQEAGITPQAFVDNVAGVIRGLCDQLNVQYDKFIRTTDKPHEKQVQKIFKRLYDQGPMRGCIVRPASLSGPNPNWWRASVPTAAGRLSLPRKKHIFSV